MQAIPSLVHNRSSDAALRSNLDTPDETHVRQPPPNSDVPAIVCQTPGVPSEQAKLPGILPPRAGDLLPIARLRPHGCNRLRCREESDDSRRRRLLRTGQCDGNGRRDFLGRCSGLGHRVPGTSYLCAVKRVRCWSSVGAIPTRQLGHVPNNLANCGLILETVISRARLRVRPGHDRQPD